MGILHEKMNNHDVSVHFVGSGDAFGSGGRFQTCILVRSARSSFWSSFLIDCGTSSLIALKAADIQPNEISAIFISHLHGDHFGGIPFFLLDAQLVSKRTEPLVIAGPPGLRTRIQSAMEILFPGSSQVKQRFDIRFTELDLRSSTLLGPVTVSAFPVVHFSGAPSYALRIEYKGHTIVYSGDTEWTDHLIEAAADADIFICEAYFFDKVMKFHLDYQTLLSHRNAFSCKRIVLTHMSQDLLSQLEQVELETAWDGKVVFL